MGVSLKKLLIKSYSEIMLRRVHTCFLVSDLCLRVHMSILEHEENEIKYKIKTLKTRPVI